MNEPSSSGMGTAQILRIVIFLSLIVVAAWLLYTIRGTLAPFFLAFVLSYLLMPLVDFLESHRLNRLNRCGRGLDHCFCNCGCSTYCDCAYDCTRRRGYVQAHCW